MTYNRWSGFEPNNVGGVEDAINFNGTTNLDLYSWNDLRSTAAIKSVIEYTYPAP